MASRGKLLLVLVLLAFAGFLLWSTLSSQAAECTVCVEFGGRRNCASASADTPEEAARQAQTTACGPLARDMNSSIACGRRPPETQQCRTR